MTTDQTTCPLCGKTFKTAGVEGHITRKHGPAIDRAQQANRGADWATIIEIVKASDK